MEDQLRLNANKIALALAVLIAALWFLSWMVDYGELV